MNIDQAIASVDNATDHDELARVATEIEQAGFEGDDLHALTKHVFHRGCALNDDED